MGFSSDSGDDIVSTIYFAFESIKLRFIIQENTQHALDFFSSYLTETAMKYIVKPPCPLPPSTTEPLVFLREGPYNASSHYSKRIIKQVIKNLHPSRRPAGQHDRTFSELSTFIVDSIEQRILSLSALVLEEILHYIQCFDISYEPHSDNTESDLIVHFLELEYSKPVIDYLTLSPSIRLSNRRRDLNQAKFDASFKASQEHWNEVEQNWPQTPSISSNLKAVSDYCTGSQWEYSGVCGVCSRQDNKVNYNIQQISLLDPDSLITLAELSILKCPYQALLPNFQFPHSSAFNGLMLDSRGVGEFNSLNVCDECKSSLARSTLPKYALRNDLYRGTLPDEFADLTFVEEMVCAKYRTTAFVVRLFASQSETQPNVFHGNVCAHNMNVTETATILPRAPADIHNSLTVVFIGPEKYKKTCTSKLFSIRKNRVAAFLAWLKINNPLYYDIEISQENLDQYSSDNDNFPQLDDSIIHDTTSDPSKVFQQESAGIQNHPAADLESASDGEPVIFLEHIGMSDPECSHLDTGVAHACALRNIFPQSESTVPDLVLHHSKDAVSEYDNPSLFPGMFPTLFPYGIGGFETNRSEKITMQTHIKYLLKSAYRDIRYHKYFLFVVFNIIQRRTGHFRTYLLVQREQFPSLAKTILSLDFETVQKVAKRMEINKSFKFTDDPNEQAVATLLRNVKSLSANIPGSTAAKVLCRNEIRSFMGFFGLSSIFWTCNPNAVNSALFQVIYGDCTINLDTRFPKLAEYNTRALRLAQDPVAATDFYEFSVRSIIDYLFGWDFKTGCSKPQGGILGHLAAWYGVNELTERGGLHGHFMIWLRGALNPTDLHKRMASDKEFENRVCSFFESIIWHHVPRNIDFDPMWESIDFRSTRPIPPPLHSTSSSAWLNQFEEQNSKYDNSCNDTGLMDTSSDIHRDFTEFTGWWSMFLSELVVFGNQLQKHKCRTTCYKYGSTDCRFMFPHEIVLETKFDIETNSFILRCLDPIMNYLNPYMAYCTRHNHDIKCILSGKAAKAAMFYISNYITKFDEKTYHVLSLLSQAVLANSDAQARDPSPTLYRAKQLLHKCLSQLTRQQQIHAQQAVWYLKGHNDSFASHSTITMNSTALLNRVKSLYSYALDDDGNEEVYDTSTDEEEDNIDPASLPKQKQTLPDTGVRVRLSPDGTILHSNQVDDYIYRDSLLANISFYDFVHRFEVKAKSTIQTTKPKRVGSARKFQLLSPHRKASTHELVEHTNYEIGPVSVLKIPRISGMSIPRPHSKIYPMFVLAHLKPFSITNPLVPPGSTFEQIINEFELKKFEAKILKNWEAIHECEDERDAERLRKQLQHQKAQEAFELSRRVEDPTNLLYIDETQGLGNTRELNPQIKTLIDTLKESGWLGVTPNNASRIATTKRTFTKKEITSYSKQLKKLNDNATGAEPINTQSNVHVSYTDASTHIYNGSAAKSSTASSELIPKVIQQTLAIDTLIDEVSTIRGLNEKQDIAFRIVAKKYMDLLKSEVDGVPKHEQPSLLMFQSGPGGTGKTYVGTSVKELMSRFGHSHCIRFIAAFGAAAMGVKGVTIHRAFKIRVVKKKSLNQEEHYEASLSASEKLKLEEEWKSIKVLYIDEIGTVGAELFAEMDQILRFVKKDPRPFGGLIVVICGDFYQLPPVRQTPLYTIARSYVNFQRKQERAYLARLGRLAYKAFDTVIELTEQKRMEKDPLYAEAVQRLRKRVCTDADVDLFNSREIYSIRNPSGIKLSEDLSNANVIVTTNVERHEVNNAKAVAVCADHVVCAASDDIEGKVVIDSKVRDYLLRLDTQKVDSSALPAQIPIFRGMPVVLRHHNPCPALGIANGSQGYVADFETEFDQTRKCILKWTLVNFPQSEISLPGLPEKHVLLGPHTHTFHTRIPAHLAIDGKSYDVKVKRSQADYDVGFCVTAHSSQGKTLIIVITSLSMGGFLAYVAASRPTSREGLVLLDRVTKVTLNKRLPEDLIREETRLQAMSHNTLVQYGFKDGEMITVPDPEEEIGLQHTLNIQFKIRSKTNDRSPKENNDNRTQQEQSRKRKADNNLHHIQGKKIVNGSDQSVHFGSQLTSWDSQDWSCAYDSMMAIFYCFQANIESNRKDYLSSYSPLAKYLFDSMSIYHGNSLHDINYIRDNMRDKLAILDPHLIRRGPVMASFERVAIQVFRQEIHHFPAIQSRMCSLCGSTQAVSSWYSTFTTMLSSNLWDANIIPFGYPLYGHNLPFTTQEWFNIMENRFVTHANPVSHLNTENSCECVSQKTFLPMVYETGKEPAIFCMEILPDGQLDRLTLCPIIISSISRQQYRLRGAVYLGNNHFTSRVYMDSIWYEHDGQKHYGRFNRLSDQMISKSDSDGRRLVYIFYIVE